VLPAFHAFAQDTVLVAHNAAFDMRFLQLQEPRTGLRFEQPVLDTLLLSAVVHPNQESHRLEAIAERFNITVLGRHTALGDAMVTAEVFLKLIPLLAERASTPWARRARRRRRPITRDSSTEPGLRGRASEAPALVALAQHALEGLHDAERILELAALEV
jgi:DNA polymerase III epsilon subunit-like protein